MAFLGGPNASPLISLEQYNRQIVHLLQQILAEVQAIRLLVSRPVKMQIIFIGGIPNMPGTMTDVQSISAVISETDAAGQPVTFDPSKVTWTVGDPTIAQLTSNPDGSATFKALAVGTTQVSAADSSNGLSAQDTLTVTAAAATSLVIKFGTPQG